MNCFTAINSLPYKQIPLTNKIKVALKKQFLFLIVAILFLVTSTTFAGVNKSTDSKSIINNLKVGLKSENYGLRISSAYILGQLAANNVIDSDYAAETIIPLLSMLNNEKDDEARIVAALALYHLDSERGIYLFNYLADNDKSERVRKIAASFYYAYYQK